MKIHHFSLKRNFLDEKIFLTILILVNSINCDFYFRFYQRFCAFHQDFVHFTADEAVSYIKFARNSWSCFFSYVLSYFLYQRLKSTRRISQSYLKRSVLSIFCPFTKIYWEIKVELVLNLTKILQNLRKYLSYLFFIFIFLSGQH